MPGLLILFTRFPRPGRAKTRLVPALGRTGAAAWQREMTARIAARAREAARRSGADLRIQYQDAEPQEMAAWLGPDLDCAPQAQGDLGTKMHRALEAAFARGYGRVVLFGCDIPGLSAEIMLRGLDLLRSRDLVLGPARDGGYYLIGLKQPRPELFREIEWSTGQVLAQALERARGLSVGLLEELADVDRPGDLAAWRREFRQGPGGISVVVPALNEELNIGSALRSATDPGVGEVIVVDGGSTDRTVELARSLGARVALHPPGRAGQQNLGAALARGGILLFLHADTRLPAGFSSAVRRTLARPGTSAGAFPLGLDGTRPGLRLIEALANFRSRVLGLPYGDQGLFMTADAFWRAGGFPDQPLMEDFELVRRLSGLGRVRTAPERVVSSARRWQNQGLLRTTLVNQLMILGRCLRVPPATLARLYARNRGL